MVAWFGAPFISAVALVGVLPSRCLALVIRFSAFLCASPSWILGAGVINQVPGVRPCNFHGGDNGIWVLCLRHGGDDIAQDPEPLRAVGWWSRGIGHAIFVCVRGLLFVWGCPKVSLGSLQVWCGARFWDWKCSSVRVGPFSGRVFPQVFRWLLGLCFGCGFVSGAHHCGFDLQGRTSILMVQLSLQWFLAMCEARSFVSVFEKLFSLLAGLLFGLLVVSVGAC